MTHTLTTDELRQIVETDHTQCGDAAAMARELLANRDAQAVAVTQFKPVSDLYALGWENGEVISFVTDPEKAVLWLTGYTGTCVQEYVKLERLQEAYTAPPAPAVPEEMKRDPDADVFDPGFMNGWNACRAAMLAQPVSSGYKLPDGFCIMPLTLTAANGAKGALSGEFKVSRTVRCHECDGEGCDDCGDAGEFEEEITVPWDTIKDIYRAAVDTCRAAMLAAAPDGGN